MIEFFVSEMRHEVEPGVDFDLVPILAIPGLGHIVVPDV